MPLDGHSYLASYGWSGKGTGLRSGAIDRPLAIPPKRNLSGVGKDRDEAFPFWDHLYSAATKAITIKIADEDEENDDEDTNEDTSTTLQLKRTATGIISNRRPISGTPASASETSTPDSDPYPRASVITIAKREAARKGLYSRFFRGPVLAPDIPSNLESPLTLSPIHSADHTPERQIVPHTHAPSTKESIKRTPLQTKEERRERRRLKRERKEKKAIKKAAKAEKQKTTLVSKDERRAAKRVQKTLEKGLPDNAELEKPPRDVTVDQSRSQGQHEGDEAKRKKRNS
ncbi:hypothetical protein AZE42_03443 [Rhizopogon vesiculosus]|uniref:G-patch domain-containing protein n=1 Tax=Rhizopogon vesiculosus TaxID=180088 RepID=A0A1J8PWH5_9AGAM|nr:hypothetical protein AZE42_03443 [Rhizopogon vesiculosus]